jgi:hypothetical protein
MLRALPLLVLSTLGCKEPLVVKTHLTLVNISPSAGAGGVGIDSPIIATFSEELEADTVDGQTAYLESAALPVVAAVSYDALSHSIQIKPEQPLSEDADYTVTFTRDITGIYSGRLGAVIMSAFTTGGGAPVNQLPIADAGADQASTAGQKVQITGSASNDPEGDPLTYSWRLVAAPADSASELSKDDTVKTALTPELSGEYIIGLTVHDGYESSSEDFVSVVVTGTASVDTGSEPEDEADTGSDTGSDTGE